ncbi:hypothetical protein ACHAWF_000831 [Thalassiosira exigua]
MDDHIIAHDRTAITTALAVLAVPLYHLLVKPVLFPKPKKEEAPRRGSLKRRPSVLEELTSVPLVLRVVIWIQCFQGLVAWLAPKTIAGFYGITELSSVDAMLAEVCSPSFCCMHTTSFLPFRTIQHRTLEELGVHYILVRSLEGARTGELCKCFMQKWLLAQCTHFYLAVLTFASNHYHLCEIYPDHLLP